MTTMSIIPRSSRPRPAVLGQLPPIRRANGSPVQVLVVDDEPALTKLIAMALHCERWVIDVARDGEQAVARFNEGEPDIVILDIMLPGTSGLRVLEHIRRAATYTPVLLLTARDSVADRVTGLSAGADDYMTKPFDFEELVARLRGLLRRNSRMASPAGETLRLGDLILNASSREVTRGGEPIALTATEFELLRYLMANPDRALRREEIVKRVWNYGFQGRPSIVDLYVSYLRKKVDAGREPMLHTVRGVGYMLRAVQ